MALYLSLPPEQGGTSFGPFTAGTFCVGTDPRSCQVVLGAMAGLRPIHAQVTLMPDGRVFLAPGERAAALWVHRRGGGAPELLDGSAALALGDAFSLGAPGGPRFALGDLPPVRAVTALPPPPPPSGRGGVTGFTQRDEAYQAAKTKGPGLLGSADGAKKLDPVVIGLIGLGVFVIFAGTCAGVGATLWAVLGR